MFTKHGHLSRKIRKVKLTPDQEKLERLACYWILLSGTKTEGRVVK